MIPVALLQKYHLSEAEAAGAVEVAVARALSQAFDMEMVVELSRFMEFLVWATNSADDEELRRIDPAELSKQLKRQIRYQIEQELEKRQALHEGALLQSFRGQVVTGEIRKMDSSGNLTIALDVEDQFRSLIVTGMCPKRCVPPHERESVRLWMQMPFLVTSVLPVQQQDRSKVLVRLSRTSKALPEVLLREKTGEPSIRCRRRIAGAFSKIETRRRLPKEAILAVGKELGERIIVRVLE